MKYLSKIWRMLKMSPIDCEVAIMLYWSEICVICKAGKATEFAISDTQLYVPVALSTQEIQNW